MVNQTRAKREESRLRRAAFRFGSAGRRSRRQEEVDEKTSSNVFERLRTNEKAFGKDIDTISLMPSYFAERFAR
jgi:hypothetical protein